MEAPKQGYTIKEYTPKNEPFYIDINGETKLFKAAYEERIPVMLKGPTGCGKSRFIERMMFEINRERKNERLPLITVPCHEDLTADDLKGRHLLDGTYQDGPALISVKNGGILYLDEIVEARSDTTVVIHPLTDHRRILIVEKLGRVFEAPNSFLLAISYNPGYQNKTKDLKQSTKQRFMAINFDYPPEAEENKIVTHEAAISENQAAGLVKIAHSVRNLKGKGLEEGASTRLLVHTGKLLRAGIPIREACNAGILNPITDDTDVYKDQREGIEDIISNYFKK
ncbi:MAG TPA: CbbQ/NirQ/NorQ/GpvN family protein [Candidatus Nanoarchaeia archaeon]|nr:CbbQ/NirQ/NorQ/GpvN family protein [Candidatus Nanoarchaeia archaeon]